MIHMRQGDAVLTAAQLAAFTATLTVGAEANIAVSTPDVVRGYVVNVTVTQVFKTGAGGGVVTSAVVDLGAKNQQVWPFTIPGIEIHSAVLVATQGDFIARLVHGEARGARATALSVYDPLSYGLYFEGRDISEKEFRFMTLSTSIRAHFDRLEPQWKVIEPSRAIARRHKGNFFLDAHVVNGILIALISWARKAMDNPGDWREEDNLIVADNMLAVLAVFEMYCSSGDPKVTDKRVNRFNVFLHKDATIRGRVQLALEHAMSPTTGNQGGTGGGDL